MVKNTKYSNVKPKPIEQANTGGNQGAYENVMKQEEEQNEIAQGGNGKAEKDPMDGFIAGATSSEPSQGENGESENPLTAVANMLGGMLDNDGGMKKDKSVNDTYQAPGERPEEEHGGVENPQQNDRSMNKALESIEGFSNNNSSTSLQSSNFQRGGKKNKHPLVAGDPVSIGQVAIATEYGGGTQQGTDAMFQAGTENNLNEQENSTYDDEALTPKETEKALTVLQAGGKRKTKRNKKSRKTRRTLKKTKTRTNRKSLKKIKGKSKIKKSLKKIKGKTKKSSKHQDKRFTKKRKTKAQKRK